MKFIVKISGEVEVEADSKAAATREAREELAFEAQQHTTRFIMLDFVAIEDEREPRHSHGCICADCAGAELTSGND